MKLRFTITEGAPVHKYLRRSVLLPLFAVVGWACSSATNPESTVPGAGPDGTPPDTTATDQTPDAATTPGAKPPPAPTSSGSAAPSPTAPTPTGTASSTPPSSGGSGTVGTACKADTDCAGGANAHCILDASGWPQGYCAVGSCTATSCPSGSECFGFTNNNSYCLKNCAKRADCRTGYACALDGACVPQCATADCTNGQVCSTTSGLCEDPPCTTGSCAAGLVCDTTTKKCIPDLKGGPAAGPGPTCSNLPVRDCVGAESYCGALIAFEPVQGTGYDNYPINGETATNQYRSYARRDLQMLVKWAAAYVDCKAKTWTGGNGKPIGLGDMSESNGAIPGTSIGQPGHPAGTHENGFDMDIAYFQVGTTDNYLRPICNTMQNGADQSHCVEPPTKLDLWRDALFLGALISSKRTRVIGVDGKVGPLANQALTVLCNGNWLPAESCTTAAKGLITYEETDQGRGWFLFHHHHQHISLKPASATPVMRAAPEFASKSALDALLRSRAAGHVRNTALPRVELRGE